MIAKISPFIIHEYEDSSNLGDKRFICSELKIYYYLTLWVS